MKKQLLFVIPLFLAFFSCATSSPWFADAPLHAAAEMGDLEEVKLLIERGSDINEIVSGKTPLHAAAIKNQLEVVNYLIDKGAEINISNPLYETVNKHYVEISRTLLEHGAGEFSFRGWYLNSISGNSELSDEKKVEIVKGIQGNMPVSPIFLMRLNPEKYSYFIKELNIDINMKNDPVSVFHNACLSFNTDLVSYLIDNGIDINSTDKTGNNALTHTVMAFGPYVDWAGPINEEEDSIIYNSDMPNFRDPKSVQMRNVATLQTLLKAGIDVNMQDEYGWSPVHFAAASKPAGLMEILIENGADLELKTSTGLTVYDLAKKSNNESVIELLNK